MNPFQEASPPNDSPWTQRSNDIKIENQDPDQDQSDELFSVEAMLAEGKAAAETAMNEEEQKPQPAASPPGGSKQAIPPNPSNTQRLQGPTTAPRQSFGRNNDGQAQQGSAAQPTASTKATDSNYTDLDLWLQITGYHDVEYRNTKLSTHKERKQLEQEAARIAGRLQKLQQDEAANTVPRGRIGSAAPAANAVAHSPRPAAMQNSGVATAATSIKRKRNEEPDSTAKGFCRHANPDYYHPPQARRPPRNSPLANGFAAEDLERRITYPEPRRGPADGRNGNGNKRKVRDPSLERRLEHYGNRPHDRQEYDRYEPHYENLPPARYQDRVPRLRFSAVNDQGLNGRRFDRRGGERYREDDHGFATPELFPKRGRDRFR